MKGFWRFELTPLGKLDQEARRLGLGAPKYLYYYLYMYCTRMDLRIAGRGELQKAVNERYTTTALQSVV